MNKVDLVGNLTKDLKLEQTQGGTAYARGTLAVQRKVKKEGQPEADFISIIFWNKQAENTVKYCGQKGMKMAVSGRLQTGQYKDKNDVIHYTTDVVVEEVEWLNQKNRNTDSGSSGEDFSEMTPVDDNKIPF